MILKPDKVCLICFGKHEPWQDTGDKKFSVKIPWLLYRILEYLDAS